ncbi:hypothetical protein [Streptomyces pristinaespiralis]|uniref:hypothetical protein n=1 Tax=Streptomyces pristinaespiralis TaxID=38300 RepID=UPI003833E953
MTQPPYYEVDVPIRSTETPTLRGVHIFTGWANSRHAAVKAAHEVYDAARAAAEAGREIPHGGARLAEAVQEARDWAARRAASPARST